MRLSGGSGGRKSGVPDELRGLLEGFETVSLEEMDNVKLMRRAETKYVMDMGELLEALPSGNGPVPAELKFFF